MRDHAAVPEAPGPVLPPGHPFSIPVNKYWSASTYAELVTGGNTRFVDVLYGATGFWD